MDRYLTIRFFAPALGFALAIGACSSGDRTESHLPPGASDTVAYRVAVDHADTVARMSALDEFLDRYPESAFRRAAYRRLYDLKEAKNPDEAGSFLRRNLEREKLPAARGILHVSLFEHASKHDPEKAPGTAKALLADPAPIPYEIYNAVSWDLAEEGRDLDLALELAEVAVAKAPDSLSKASCLDTKGWIYYQKGDYPQAVALLEEARKMAPERIEEVEVHLAKAYHAAGKQDEAKALYLELLLSQENPEMREAVAQLTRESGGSPEQVFRDLDRRRVEGAKPAADFTLVDYSGNKVRLSDFKGSIVLLNFWHPT